MSSHQTTLQRMCVCVCHLLMISTHSIDSKWVPSTIGSPTINSSIGVKDSILRAKTILGRVHWDSMIVVLPQGFRCVAPVGVLWGKELASTGGNSDVGYWAWGDLPFRLSHVADWIRDWEVCWTLSRSSNIHLYFFKKHVLNHSLVLHQNKCSFCPWNPFTGRPTG